MLTSALGETVDRASLAAAQKVFRDGFFASRGAGDLLLPRRPLGEIFGDRLGRWLADHGVRVRLETPVRRIEGDGRRADALLLADGSRQTFDAVIVAVPWHVAPMLLAEPLRAAVPRLAEVEWIEPAAITAVHLWFDRPAVPLPHAVLVGRLSQWVFTKNLPARTDSPPQCSLPQCSSPRQYCQVVVSASHRLAPRTHDQWLDAIRGELAVIWPAVGEAKLLHGRVVAQPAALFSCVPGLDRFRPLQQTPIENLALAGDWTSTGWPATMEGAIRSGRLAAESLFSSAVPNDQTTRLG